MERDLLEKLLTAQVLTLAEMMPKPKAGAIINRPSNPIEEAIEKIASSQTDIISRLTARTPA